MELISREEAVKIARLMIGLTADERENEIRAIPTVEERKEGEWIDHSNEGYVECPFCGSCTTCEDNIDELHFCFNCGNKLTGE